MAECYQAPADTRAYSQEACEALMKTDFALLERIGNVIASTKKTGATIFTAGNGGSAATASHMANDLTKGCRVDGREGFRVHCLNDPNAIVTCLANDFCYADVYKIMLRTQARPRDVLIVFSGSGNSPNIVAACETAKEMGLTVIGFGGRDGGKMKPLCDLCLIAPTESMEQLEDLHMIYNHALVCYLKKVLSTTWDVETVRYPAGGFRHAIFDFDGTVSLLREGWQPIMYGYFTEELLKCPNAPGKDETYALVRDFVDTLTGKQTIFQCIRLAEEVTRLGGTPQEPLHYKTEYLRRLMERIAQRHAALKEGADPAPYLVHGVRELLQALNARGVECHLTSGTDEADVVAEAKLLGVAQYFAGIHGATDQNSTACSKEQVIRALLKEKGLQGAELLSFGDGFVEIELTKAVGGYAVAVATNEAKADTSVERWKRERLLKAGADCVIPDFSNPKRLMAYLLREV
ncbi:MAG: SIS domain-containing protein [Oscillospiraceae bacterium]|nr:SIS domain-containing protein [Oscillospiraceae bacterium]